VTTAARVATRKATAAWPTPNAPRGGAGAEACFRGSAECLRQRGDGRHSQRADDVGASDRGSAWPTSGPHCSALLRQRTAAEYAEQEATLPTWRGFYGPEPPDILGDRAIDESNEVVAVTRARLHRLVAAGFWLYRPLRARRTLRIRAVTVLGPVLVLAGAGLGVALWQARVAGWTVVLAAAAGLTGAALSGFIKFRDEVRLGAQVRQFMPFYLVQLTVGAVFGLLVVLVVAAGWLTSETNTAVIGIISFAAGFSEPFAVGLVTKVAERTSV
jgi:hypothetical protein